MVSLAWTFCGDVRRGNDVNLMAEMIERQQAVKEHQHTIGKLKIVLGVVPDAF